MKTHITEDSQKLGIVLKVYYQSGHAIWCKGFDRLTRRRNKQLDGIYHS
jgi:hypothetical protein